MGMPDREKYIAILSKTVKTVKEFNEDAPIKISLECVEDILELLKEQPEIVRCKDCKHFDGLDCRVNDIVNIMNTDWFCADGECKEGK